MNSSRGERAETGAGRPSPEAVATARSVQARIDHARRVLAGQLGVPSGRFALPKAVLLPALRVLTGRLVEADQVLADAVEMLDEAHTRALDAVLADQREQSERHERTTAELREAMRVLEQRVATVTKAREQDNLELRRLRMRLEQVGEGASSGSSEGARPDGGASAEPLSDADYLEFERRFRGSPEEILRRQREAAGFVAPLAGGDAPLLDLGSGRGEWLAVLRDVGIPAYGVDSNEEMVAAARANGLDARAGDAISHLEQVPEGSLGGVSAFHFVEHIPVPVLRRVLDAAFLALRPGGILLLETPDPTNVVVGSASFYLDPTHLRPVHPLFLEFLVEMRGFADVQLHHVHPVDELLATPSAVADGSEPSVHDRILDAAGRAIFGAQDYVLVARRAPAEIESVLADDEAPAIS